MSAQGQEWYSRWDQAGKTWNEKWTYMLDHIHDFPTGDQIDILGAAVRVGSDPVLSEEKRIVFNRAQTALIAIPVHAKYYQDKIEFLRAEVLANAAKSDEAISRMQDNGEKVVHVSDFESFGSMIAFPTLRLLPSAESVAVLGYYLNDPVGRDGKTLVGGYRHRPGDDFPPSPCNSEMAAGAMRNLGIEKPPFTRSAKTMSDQEVDAWKDWWNEIKSGKRTYRFIGSPIEYGPDGPANKEVIQRAQLNMKRNEERATGHRRSTSVVNSKYLIAQVSKPLSIAGFLAGCALVAASVWYFLKCRKAA